MLIDNKTVISEGTLSDFTPSRIDDSNFGLALDFFASIYSRPRDAVLRELAANGVDAQRDAGYNGPVEISLPTLDSPHVIVTDHGTGMDDRTLTSTFGEYLASTKRESPDDIGGFGVGSKTPFSVADQFTVTSTKNGITRLMIFTKLPGGGTGHKIVSELETGRPSGTSVSVPVGLEDHNEWVTAAKRVFYSWDRNAVLVDGQAPETFHDNVSQIASTDSWHTLKEDAHKHKPFAAASVFVRINGIGYEIPGVMTYACKLDDVVIEAPNDAPLTISRSRETIDDTDAARAWLSDARQQWEDAMRARMDDLFDSVTDTTTAARIFNSIPTKMAHASYAYTNLYCTVKALGLPHSIETPVITYYTRPDKNRSALDELYANLHSDMHLKAPFITPEEFTPKVQRCASKWAKAQDTENKIALTVISPDAPDFDRFFPAREIRWITGEELIAQTPKPKKNKSERTDVTVKRVVGLNIRGLQITESIELDDVRKLADAGKTIVMTSLTDIRDLDHFDQQYVFGDHVALLLKGNRSVARFEKALDRPVLTVKQAIEGRVDELLRQMTPKQRREVAMAITVNLDDVDRSSIKRLLDMEGLVPKAKKFLQLLATDIDWMLQSHRDLVCKHELMAAFDVTQEFPMTRRLIDVLTRSRALCYHRINSVDISLINTAVAADLAQAAQ